MKTAADVHLTFIENNGILFSEQQQKIYGLNTCASYIWCLIEEKKTPLEITIKLKQIFKLTTQEAQQYLDESIQQWQQHGLLSGFEHPDLKLDPDDTSSSNETLPLNYIPQFTQHYQLLNSFFTLGFSSSNLFELINPILAHLSKNIAPTKNKNICFTVINVVEKNNQFFVFLNHQEKISCQHLNQLAPIIKGLLWNISVEQYHFFLDIHAAVVSKDKQCLLFPAAAGSGKSTLTASLIRNGFKFFSDEVALLNEDNFSVCPTPLAICVKNTGIQALKHYYPELEKITAHLRCDGKVVRYLLPPQSSIEKSEGNFPIKAIIFPKYQPHKKNKLIPISKINALTRLLDQCLIVSTKLTLNKVEKIIDWVEVVPCYELSIADTGIAIAKINALTEKLFR